MRTLGHAVSTIAALVTWISVAAGPVAASDVDAASKDLTVEQRAMSLVDVPTGPMQVSAWLDRADATYAPGDAPVIFVKPARDAFVTIIDVGTSGRATVLFPNREQPDGRVAAHDTLRVGNSERGYRLRVEGPAGRDLIKVIATERPLDLSGLTIGASTDSTAGPFRTLDAPAAIVAERLGRLIARERAGTVATRTTILTVVSPRATRH